MTLKFSKRDILFFSWKKCKLDVAENGNTNLLHTDFTQSYLILKSLKVLPFKKTKYYNYSTGPDDICIKIQLDYPKNCIATGGLWYI